MSRTKRKRREDLIIGITRKGSLAARVHDLCYKAGYLPVNALNTRKFEIPSLQDGFRFRFWSTKGMPEDVINGRADIGFSGADIIASHNLDKEEGITVLAEFPFSRASNNPARLVMGTTPKDTGITKIDECRGKKIASEYVSLTRRQLKDKFGFTEADCKGIFPVAGAAEGYLLCGDADALADILETGETFKQNDIIELDELFRSIPQLIFNNLEMWRNKDLWQLSEKFACDLLNVLTLEREPLEMMRANVRTERLQEALQLLPALNSPDYNPSADPKNAILGKPQYTEAEDGFYVVTTVIPQSQRAKVAGILEGTLGADVKNIISIEVHGLHSTTNVRKLLYPPQNGKN